MQKGGGIELICDLCDAMLGKICLGLFSSLLLLFQKVIKLQLLVLKYNFGKILMFHFNTYFVVFNQNSMFKG